MRYLVALMSIFLVASLANGQGRTSDSVNEDMVGVPFENPYWFKESFLEIEMDVEEAVEQEKALLLYFHQQGCPYCRAMIQKNIAEPRTRKFIQDHFDVVQINIRGAREVTLPDGTLMNERDFAQFLGVQYTPTIIVLDDSNLKNPRGRMNGFRPLPTFHAFLEEVTQNPAVFDNEQLSVVGLYEQEYFLQTNDLTGLSDEKPLAVFLETQECADCRKMHSEAFSNQGTYEYLKQYNVVQFDAASDAVVTLPSGEKRTVQEWVQAKKLNYYPTVLLYAAGSKEESFRMDSYLRSFHVQSALEYVLEKRFQDHPEFQRFIDERSARIRAERSRE